MIGYLAHPAAEIFPLMEGKAFDELVNDIKAVGLREPVVLCDGKILDGRNRLRACERARVNPAFTEFDGPDPLRFVISKNLIRRHLRDSQRAMIAAELADKKLGDNKFKSSGSISQSEASQLLGVAERSVHRAVVVKRNGTDELKRALREGVIGVGVASRIARLPSAKQKTLVSKGNRALIAAARRSRKNHVGSGRQQYATLWKHVDAICDALERSQLDKAHSAGSDLLKELKRVAGSRRRA